MGPGSEAGVPPTLVSAMTVLRKVGIAVLRRFHRLEVTLTRCEIDGPVLFVANHGFGGIADINVFAALAALDDLQLDRQVTILTHQMAWTFKIGKLIEAVHARPASRTAAAEAFARGEHVLVFPGGDVENAKSFGDRNKVIFSGRRGFAHVAVDAEVPIVPIVTAGAGESLLVLSDGQWLARLLHLDMLLRMKAVPISVSIPWGLNVGGVGIFLPYLPLPAKVWTTVLDPMRPGKDESADAFGDRVEAAMQAALTAMTTGRRLLIG